MTRVNVSLSDHVAHVVLDRPEKMNALDALMLEEIVAAGEEVRSMEGCRAVVLSGRGRGFCSGLDLGNLQNAAAGKDRKIDISKPFAGAANIAQYAVLQWKDVPVPVIAAVHGVALGGGFQLMLGADVRIVHPETKLGVIEAKWGLVPDMAGMVLLRELISPDMLAEIAYTARVLDGPEALRLGLVTRVSDDPLTSAFALAREIAARSPDAVRAMKRLLLHRGTRDEILRAEAAEQGALFGKPNQREAVAAGLAKRAASFVD
jgi:enoyl-CoA hydratase/carnithine racemase